jgi:hypothetical protein
MRISSFKDYQKRAHCPRPPLSAYLEDYLSPAQRDLTERHIAGCTRCAAQLAEMRQAMAQVGQLGRVTVPPDTIRAALAEVDPQAALRTPEPVPAPHETVEDAPLLWEDGIWKPVPRAEEGAAPRVAEQVPPFVETVTAAGDASEHSPFQQEMGPVAEEYAAGRPAEGLAGPPAQNVTPPWTSSSAGPLDPASREASTAVPAEEPAPAAAPSAPLAAPPPIVVEAAPPPITRWSVGQELPETPDEWRDRIFAQQEAAAPSAPSEEPAAAVPVFVDPLSRGPSSGVPRGQAPDEPSQWPARVAAVVAAALVLGVGVVWSASHGRDRPLGAGSSQPTSSVSNLTAAPTQGATAPAPSATPAPTPAPAPAAPVNLRVIRIKDNGAYNQQGVFNPKLYEIVLDLSTLDGKAPSYTANQDGNTITLTIPGFNPSGVPAFQAPESAPITSVVPKDGLVTITFRSVLPYTTWTLDAPPQPRVVVDLTRP